MTLSETTQLCLRDLSYALLLYDLDCKMDAASVMRGYFNKPPLDCPQDLWDVIVETYIFITDGDLRQFGRNVGFASTDAIRDHLKQVVANMAEVEG